MSLTEIAFWLVYLGGIGAAVIYPVVGVLLYIFVYHVNPESQWWGDNIRAAGLRTAFTVALATVAGLLLRGHTLPRPPRWLSLPVTLMIGLLALAAVSLTFGAAASERGLYQTEKFAKIIIFVLLLVRCVQSPRHYHLAIAAWLLGLLYIGYQAWGNVGVREAGRLSFGLGGPDFAESSDLSVHLVASLPLVGAMFFMARRWWERGAVLAIGALAVNTLIMTRTRNAIPGLIAITVTVALSLPRGYRLKGWAAIVVGALLAAQLADPGWWRRMETIAQYQSDPAAVGRLMYWQAAIEMAGEHPFGIGIGNFHDRVREYVPGLLIERSAHNTFMECLAELGYPGAVVLVAIVAVTLIRLTAVRRRSRCFESTCPVPLLRGDAHFHLGWHALALRAALIGYLACGMFTTRLWAEDFWILVGLAACLRDVAERMEAVTEIVPAAPALADPALRPESTDLRFQT